MSFDWRVPQPVRRVQAARSPVEPIDPDVWPATLAPVAQVLREGLDLGQLTVLVGENGTGKSTLLEAIAIAYGLSAEGGSTGAMHATRATESSLHEHLTLVRGAGASRWGYFLRAETMHGLFSYLQDTLRQDFHSLSHGESFLRMINDDRFVGDGFFVMDEPEAGLSFTAQLALVGAVLQMTSDQGTQVLIATHSPVIAAIPGARLLQLDEGGITEVDWDDLAMVDHHRRFLQAPGRYLRHLTDAPD